MAERGSRHIPDEEDTLPEIETVYTLNKTTVSSPPDDPFSREGTFVKSLAGTDANFKRRVTNELKKFNRSADGKTESKQVDDVTEVSGYDAFGVVTPPHNLEGFATIYQEISAPHYAAVNAKVDNIVGLGFKLVETPKTKRLLESIEGNEKKLTKIRKELAEHRQDLLDVIDSFNEEENLTEILIRVWRDYEVTGNGYLEVGRKRDGTIGYIGHIPATSIRIRRKRDGFVQIAANKAQFFLNFGDKKTSNPIADTRPNEIIHIKRYTPTSGYYGVPDIVAAQAAIAGSKFAENYNLEFFENKAVPRHLITLKGAGLGSQAQADLLTFFETGLKGQNHRSLFIPLPSDSGDNKVEFDIEAIDAKVQESSFDKFEKSNQAKILMVHRVPISKVNTAEGASLAIARDADKTFKEQVCGPQQRNLEKKLNRIIKELTDAFELKLNELSLTDAETQSKIDERNVKNGIWTPNEVRTRDGMPSIKGGDERTDLNAPAKVAAQKAEATTNRERDSARSAASPDKSGEARQPKGDGRAQG